MTTGYIAARTPQAVALEVESRVRAGFNRFVLQELDGGGMLDQERLGAGRYAAGLQMEVVLEGEASIPLAEAR